MKRVLIFTLLLILQHYGFSQAKTGSTPFKGANKIVIHTDSSASFNYKTILSILVDNGYTIEKKDNDLLTARTDLKPLPYKVVHLISIVAKDKALILSSLFSSGVNVNIGLGIRQQPALKLTENAGLPTSDYRTSFNAMNSIATKMNGRIEYLKESN